ncbi:MAG: hypothetical protein M4D80_32280 [Myxococcota bacterium]|nr:hypothetical protein [Deltaproteobacteria bacterium]MDQ3339861.1 hypothetical protein [Myxococcota bacterium]
MAAADPICEDTRINVTAGPNPQDGPILDGNTTYAIAGFAPGKKSFVVFEAQVSGEHELSFGGAPVHVALVDEPPTATTKAPDCMRSASTYELVAGERYEVELGAIPSSHRVLLHVKAPIDEDKVAQRSKDAQRFIDAGWGSGAGFAAVRFCEPSTYSTASWHDRLSYAIRESRSLNTSGHSMLQRRFSSAPAPALHET